MNILRKTKINVAWNRGGFISILSLLILLQIMFMWYLGRQGSVQAYSVHISPIKLDIKSAPSTKPVFQVFYPTSNDDLALLLGKELVKKLKRTNDYSAVEITYYLGVSDKTMRLQKGMFDLFLAKPVFEKSLPENIGANRIPLAEHPTYEVFLISKNDSPKLDGNYLFEKSVGLRADHFSESGYIYPKKVIMGRIKKEKLPSFKSIYATHKDMRKGLLDSEVDLIASYWGPTLSKKYPNWKFLKIGKADGPRWYLDQRSSDPDVTCAVIKALNIHAEKQDKEYWKKLKDLTSCDRNNE